MLEELADVLGRDKFHVRNTDVESFLTILLKKSKLVAPRSRLKVILEDPDDDVVLNTAYKGKADYIVTGDRHLLALKKFKRIEIVRVAQMFEILKQHQK
jgi:putative PIN family toxin of toxin-antitoxin system